MTDDKWPDGAERCNPALRPRGRRAGGQTGGWMDGSYRSHDTACVFICGAAESATISVFCNTLNKRIVDVHNQIFFPVSATEMDFYATKKFFLWCR